MLSSLKELDALFSVRKSLGSFDNSRDLIRDMKIDSILFYFDIIDNSITELLPKVEEYDRSNDKNTKGSKKSAQPSIQGSETLVSETKDSETKKQIPQTEKQKLLQEFKELSSEITMILEQGKTAKNLKNDYRSKIL